MATGTNKTWTASFTAYVGDDHLLNIHFFWAGKGSFPVPDFSYAPAALSLNGPLVAGISVTASKELHFFYFCWAKISITPYLVKKIILGVFHYVYPDFKVGGKGLSPSQIAGITAGSVFAPLLLLAFMWKMGWLPKSELDGTSLC